MKESRVDCDPAGGYGAVWAEYGEVQCEYGEEEPAAGTYGEEEPTLASYGDKEPAAGDYGDVEDFFEDLPGGYGDSGPTSGGYGIYLLHYTRTYYFNCEVANEHIEVSARQL